HHQDSPSIEENPAASTWTQRAQIGGRGHHYICPQGARSEPLRPFPGRNRRGENGTAPPPAPGRPARAYEMRAMAFWRKTPRVISTVLELEHPNSSSRYPQACHGSTRSPQV